MNSHTQTKVFSATKETVFSFLSDIQNLTKWATGFAKDVKSVEGKYKVITPQGEEVFFRMETDEKSGIIDMYIGPKEGQMAYFPGRVMEISKNKSAYSFTNIQYRGISDEVFAAINKTLIEEFENIRKHVEVG